MLKPPASNVFFSYGWMSGCLGSARQLFRFHDPDESEVSFWFQVMDDHGFVFTVTWGYPHLKRKPRKPQVMDGIFVKTQSDESWMAHQ